MVSCDETPGGSGSSEPAGHLESRTKRVVAPVVDDVRETTVQCAADGVDRAEAFEALSGESESDASDNGEEHAEC
jgi:hypothetical protein